MKGKPQRINRISRFKTALEFFKLLASLGYSERKIAGFLKLKPTELHDELREAIRQGNEKFKLSVKRSLTRATAV